MNVPVLARNIATLAENLPLDAVEKEINVLPITDELKSALCIYAWNVQDRKA